VPARIDAVRPARPTEDKPSPMLELLAAELTRSMDGLGKHADPPYFASYEVTDGRHVDVAAAFGALLSSTDNSHRSLDVDVRVGDYKLDNTHRSEDLGDRIERLRNTQSASLPLEEDDYAIRSILWAKTDAAYKSAAEQLAKVQANTKVKVKADDTSDDFSKEPPAQYVEAPATLTIDRTAWESRLRTLSGVFREHPDIIYGAVQLSVEADTRYYVSSDGTRVQEPYTHARVSVTAATQASDGMELHRFEAFDVARPEELPSDEQIRAKIDLVIKDLIALRDAPIAEPYSGPAILEGKAASVFFHEVFGHRIEGHRQKDDIEGQTFAKKIGSAIAPDFVNVYDDPTISAIDGIDVNGFYRYDNEGVAAQKASLIESGVLKTFLMERSPTRGVVHSNGHGRRQEGRSVVARQGNLVVAPSRTVDHATLRAMLLAEVKAQGKPYGIVFRELDGGHTSTSRFSAQAFKLLPVMVYRVYPDGHEELVRGADLEGTPLSALGDIKAAGDDVETFNGFCGAESGFVPVSSTSPSLLVGHIEVTKRVKGSDRLPVLPPPPLATAKGAKP
jgi:TldD protein